MDTKYTLTESDIESRLGVLQDDLDDLPEVVEDWDSLSLSEQAFHDSEWGVNLLSIWPAIVRNHQESSFSSELETQFLQVAEGRQAVSPVPGRAVAPDPQDADIVYSARTLSVHRVRDLLRSRCIREGFFKRSKT